MIVFGLFFDLIFQCRKFYLTRNTQKFIFRQNDITTYFIFLTYASIKTLKVFICSKKMTDILAFYIN